MLKGKVQWNGPWWNQDRDHSELPLANKSLISSVVQTEIKYNLSIFPTFNEWETLMQIKVFAVQGKQAMKLAVLSPEQITGITASWLGKNKERATSEHQQNFLLAAQHTTKPNAELSLIRETNLN